MGFGWGKQRNNVTAIGRHETSLYASVVRIAFMRRSCTTVLRIDTAVHYYSVPQKFVFDPQFCPFIECDWVSYLACLCVSY